MGTLMNDIAVQLIDELLLESIFEFHRLVKLGLFCPCSDPQHEYVDTRAGTLCLPVTETERP